MCWVTVLEPPRNINSTMKSSVRCPWAYTRNRKQSENNGSHRIGQTHHIQPAPYISTQSRNPPAIIFDFCLPLHPITFGAQFHYTFNFSPASFPKRMILAPACLSRQNFSGAEYTSTDLNRHTIVPVTTQRQKTKNRTVAHCK